MPPRRSSAEVRCAYCAAPVRPGLDALVPCRRCFVLYHVECWWVARRCAIYGCRWTDRRAGRPALPAEPRAARVVWGPALRVAAGPLLFVASHFIQMEPSHRSSLPNPPVIYSRSNVDYPVAESRRIREIFERLRSGQAWPQPPAQDAPSFQGAWDPSLRAVARPTA